MKIFITGVAGFIGFNLAHSIIKNKKNTVYGVDNFDNYYSINLKKKRLKILKKYKNFHFKKIDICDYLNFKNFIGNNKFDIAINLAAQAGVRYSLINPRDYIQSNIVGFFNILGRVILAKK